MMKVDVRFVKTHADAILPKRSHSNRAMYETETETIDAENRRMSKDHPQEYAMGYRVGFPMEKNEAGEDVVVGTGDTGFDVYCVEGLTIPAKGSAIVNTGLELSYISPGYWFMISARSGLGFKSGIQPHPGIVDNGYRGGLGVKLYNLSDTDYTVNAGDRIAQLVFYPVIEPTMGWAEAIQTSPRNDKGFGSSGK